ncbi:fimbrial protein [Vibrio algarum]|uniref:Fimbrial protein n=1 Tax=Vibrio algarum TaxID=3020714 RepID=A0ABT4YR52_9VIBR|nr:fimbrial protein [Vibrio sp. KJ40-1]MDB1123993.1 fimbrial protein [Vibrio sp. KJ40-1]
MKVFYINKTIIFILLCGFFNSKSVVAECLTFHSSLNGTLTPIVNDFAMLNTTVGGIRLSNWSAPGVYALSIAGPDAPCPNPGNMSLWSVRPTSLPASIGSIVTSGGGGAGGTRTYSVFPTEYDNIGYIVHAYDIYTGSFTGDNQVKTYPSGYSGKGIRNQIRFVFFGQILPGVYTLARRQVSRAAVSEQKDVFEEHSGIPVYYNGHTFTVTGNTCTIDANDKNQTVTLASATEGNFNGVGSKVGSQPFSIKVQCGAGITLSAIMTDVNLPTNNTDILTLDDSSTATGVGLQIYANNNANPVTFSMGLDAKNVWSIGGSTTAQATTYNIPFTANYIQTEADITPGSVNAMSMISLTYK